MSQPTTLDILRKAFGPRETDEEYQRRQELERIRIWRDNNEVRINSDRSLY